MVKGSLWRTKNQEQRYKIDIKGEGGGVYVDLFFHSSLRFSLG